MNDRYESLQRVARAIITGAHRFEARTGRKPTLFYLGESEAKYFLDYINFCEQPYSPAPIVKLYNVNQVKQWMGMKPVACELDTHLGFSTEEKP